MKKNAMLKIAAVLLVAVLLTTCAISSTFAKYATTGDDFEDSARVARWGVTVETNLDSSDSGFEVEYKADDTKWVKSRGTDKVIAPGTSGTLKLNFKVIIDKPEVSGKVVIKDKANGENYIVDNTGGAIIWKVNGQEKSYTEVNAAIAALNYSFTPESANFPL